jgi:hypothetical protein
VRRGDPFLDVPSSGEFARAVLACQAFGGALDQRPEGEHGHAAIRGQLGGGSLGDLCFDEALLVAQNRCGPGFVDMYTIRPTRNLIWSRTTTSEDLGRDEVMAHTSSTVITSGTVVGPSDKARHAEIDATVLSTRALSSGQWRRSR